MVLAHQAFVVANRAGCDPLLAQAFSSDIDINLTVEQRSAPARPLALADFLDGVS